MESPLSTIPCLLGKFHLFPNLPSEIRLKIWRHSFSSPRVLASCLNSLAEWQDEDQDFSFSYIVHQQKAALNSQPPTALSVCPESRQEALRFYQLRAIWGPYRSPVYVNLSHDMVYLENLGTRIPVADYAGLISLKDREEICSLALDADGFSLLYRRFRSDAVALKDFPKLKTLLLVRHFRECEDNWCEEEPDMKIVEPSDSRTAGELKADLQAVVKVFKELQDEDTSWNAPEVIMRVLMNGNRRCCYAERGEISNIARVLLSNLEE